MGGLPATSRGERDVPGDRLAVEFQFDLIGFRGGTAEKEGVGSCLGELRAPSHPLKPFSLRLHRCPSVELDAANVVLPVVVLGLVFEGNAPADVRENSLLRELLRRDAVEPVTSRRCWLGAPNSIKGPTEAVFHRQSGSNLIVIGQREEAALAMLAVSLVSLAAQSPKDGIRFVVCDGTTPGSTEEAFLKRVVEAVPHELELVKNSDLSRVMGELGEEMKRRSSDEEVAATASPVFLLVHNLQKFKKLKHEDDFDFSFDSDDAGPSPGAQLNEIVTEGTSHGLHVVATVDTYNNVNRFLSRKSLSEFEMRVIFQMSQNDSAALVDSPAASNLGLHRALFYNEHEGSLETFRPYALPGNEWVEDAGRALKGLIG
tara:strand:- start:139 stop:1257 length:1119 start_codon:yes stop_codon:yes gene_type:complete